ncbi:MAG: DHA2 family efflux MFS transporter permease subunit [Candidatus Eremiobacteraeota bacterium]|nr:DHA2 family efflux MFS transporter permease subunit [Candidatus Eremiobacteraeota bacterium]
MASLTETQAPERTSVVEHGFRRIAIVAGVMLAALMQTLDSTITNVALPTIQGNLGASSDEGTWVINGYTIAVVIVIPIIPWLQTVLGRKRYFLISIAGFTLMSFICGISTSIDELILFRVLQGVFGAGLLATGQSIIRDTFDESQLGLSQAIFALGAVGGPALGPPIGGLLVDNVSWNWIFEINLPIGIASFLVLSSLLRDPEKASKKPLDIVGLLLLMVGVGAFQFLLSEGERYDWLSDPNIRLCAVLAVCGIVGLILWEMFGTRTPIVDIAIFRYRSMSAGLAIALIVGAALLGTQYVLPQYVQQSLGFTATLSGLLVLVKALPIAVLTMLVAPLVTKFDARIFMAIGFGLTALSCFWQGIATTGISEFGTFVVSLIVGGAGVALIYVPVSVAVLGAVPQERGGSATSWINLAVQLGGSISIALLSTIIDRRSAFHLTALAGSVSPSNAHLSAIPTVSQLSNLAQSVSREATVLAYADSSYVVALVAVVAIPVVFIMRKPRTGGTVEIGG